MKTTIIEKKDDTFTLEFANILGKNGGVFEDDKTGTIIELNGFADMPLIYCTFDTVNGTVSVYEGSTLYVYVFKNDELIRLEKTEE